MKIHRICKEKKGFTLVASIMVSLVLGIIMMVSFIRAASHMGFLRSSQDGKDALCAAFVGLENALNQLRTDIDWVGNPVGTFIPIDETVDENVKNFGDYNVWIDVAGTTYSPNGVWRLIPAIITGRNSIQNSTHTAIRQLSVLIKAQSPAAFFISSLSPLTIQAGADIGSNVLGLDIAFGAATEEHPININNGGNAIYLRNLSGEDNPNIHFNGDPAGEIRQSEPITFVGIDKDRYIDNAQNGGGYYHQGGGTLVIDNAVLDRNNYLFSGIDNAENGFVYADGDVEISVQEVLDPMVIVAGGNIYITGDIKYDNISDPFLGDQLMQLGLFAKGDIIIENPGGGDRTIEAFLSSEGNLKALGDRNENGVLDFYGAMAIRGRDDNTGSAINLSTFQDRNYRYHSALLTNSQIEMNYMADVVEWSIIGDPVDLAN
ncbi:MAG: hypothetical protein P9M07_00625 [Candidatus Aceula meridiana]|nr:hypothetical protein [Candidatus Aceula meridiana]